MVGGLAIHLQNKNDYRDEIKEDLKSQKKKIPFMYNNSKSIIKLMKKQI